MCHHAFQYCLRRFSPPLILTQSHALTRTYTHSTPMLFDKNKHIHLLFSLVFNMYVQLLKFKASSALVSHIYILPLPVASYTHSSGWRREILLFRTTNIHAQCTRIHCFCPHSGERHKKIRCLFALTRSLFRKRLSRNIYRSTLAKQMEMPDMLLLFEFMMCLCISNRKD